MSRFYRIRVIGPIMIFEHLSAPRLKIFIRIDKGIPEIIKISLVDECSPRYIAGIIKRINHFLIRFSQRNMKKEKRSGEKPKLAL